MRPLFNISLVCICLLNVRMVSERLLLFAVHVYGGY